MAKKPHQRDDQQAGQHDQTAFLEWLRDSGIEVLGLHAEHISGRGFGVRASRNLKAGERLVFVPANVLVTIDSTLVHKYNLPRTMTVHGRIAAALALSNLKGDEFFPTWTRFWPRMNDFESMPILWEKEDVLHLPQSAQGQLGPILLGKES